MQETFPLRLGGVGDVYLLAEPGELIVDVQKQKLSRSSQQTQLQAILVAPDCIDVHVTRRGPGMNETAKWCW